MSEQTPEPGPQDEAGVERGGMDEASGAPLTETEIETSKKPEDRDSDV
ncbi:MULTISPECIES: hypothetical protein [Geodermatophilus]|uniref:Uncharacterized protein n=1 Tax=Geodermatophilus arenarius TaxID=1137990 RepID=A0ABV9LLA3_9ACTN